MSNATKDIKTDEAEGALRAFPVAASTFLYAGTFCAVNGSGNAIATLTGSSKIFGRVEKQVDNSTGAAGDKYVDCRTGNFYLNNDATNPVSNSYRGAYCFAVDNNTVGTSDVGGTLPIAGYVLDVPASGSPNYGKVLVAVGQSYPGATTGAFSASSLKARGVATSLAAFATSSGVLTASANGALGAQDGITVAVGDIIVIPAGTVGSATVSAADSGPWQFTSVGGASSKFTAIRPDWYAHGASFIAGSVIEVGGEGTLFGGTDWKTYAAASGVVGTDDPKLYPQQVTQQVTLVAGTKTVSNVPVYSASRVGVNATLAGGTPAGTTTAYQTKLSSGITAGALGTAAVIVEAQSVAGTKVATDVAVLNVTITNV